MNLFWLPDSWVFKERPVPISHAPIDVPWGKKNALAYHATMPYIGVLKNGEGRGVIVATGAN